MKMWQRAKRKVITTWNRFKAWVYGLLVAIGIVAMPIQAITVDFTYIRATTHAGGTPMDPAEIKETRLYCDGNLVVSELGADENFNPDLIPGTYSCYAVHVDAFDREGMRSNIVEKTVLPSLLGPPVLN